MPLHSYHREIGFLIVSILLIFGLVSGVAPIAAQDSSQTSISPRIGLSENVSRTLYLETPANASEATTTLSVTDGLASVSGQAEVRLAQYSFEAQLSRAETQEQRARISRNVTYYYALRVTQLQAIESRSRSELLAGEISMDRYLQRLGTVHRRAESLRDSIDSVQTQEGLSDFARSDLAELDGNLVSFEGPIQTQLAEGVYRSGSSPQVFATVSPNGFTLSTIQGDAFIHEAYIPTNRDTVEESVRFSEGVDLAQSYYPHLVQSGGGRSISTRGEDILVFSFTDGLTDTTGYLDTSSEQVFYERQRLSLVDEVETKPLRTVSGNNTTLIVSDTYLGGPLKIHVENQTDAPQQARVYLNQTQVGETNENGNFWTIARQPPYPVRVTTNEANLTVNVPSYE